MDEQTLKASGIETELSSNISALILLCPTRQYYRNPMKSVDIANAQSPFP